MNRNIDLKIWQGQAGYADIEATRSRLTFTTDLVEAAQVVDLVIEAVPDIKIDIYKKLAAVMPEVPEASRVTTGLLSQRSAPHFSKRESSSS